MVWAFLRVRLRQRRHSEWGYGDSAIFRALSEISAAQRVKPRLRCQFRPSRSTATITRMASTVAQKRPK